MFIIHIYGEREIYSKITKRREYYICMFAFLIKLIKPLNYYALIIDKLKERDHKNKAYN